MKTAMRFLPNVLAAALAISTSSALGVDYPADNWHQIEVLVFAQADPYGAEQSPQAPLLQYPSPLRLLDNGDQLYPDLTTNATYSEQLAALMVPPRFLRHETASTPLPFVPLAESERQLNPDAYTLKRNSGYRVLFHQAWRQPVTTRKAAQWVFINGGNRFADHTELEGSLRISQARYYHVDTNLWLASFQPAIAALPIQPEETANLPEATPAATKIQLPEAPQLPKSPLLAMLEAIPSPMATNFEEEPADLGQLMSEDKPTTSPQFEVAKVDVLKDSSRVRLKSLYYIDHPRMGVLVMITPLDADAASEDEEPGAIDME